MAYTIGKDPEKAFRPYITCPTNEAFYPISLQILPPLFLFSCNSDEYATDIFGVAVSQG